MGHRVVPLEAAPRVAETVDTNAVFVDRVETVEVLQLGAHRVPRAQLVERPNRGEADLVAVRGVRQQRARAVPGAEHPWVAVEQKGLVPVEIGRSLDPELFAEAEQVLLGAADPPHPSVADLLETENRERRPAVRRGDPHADAALPGRRRLDAGEAKERKGAEVALRLREVFRSHGLADREEKLLSNDPLAGLDVESVPETVDEALRLHAPVLEDVLDDDLDVLDDRVAVLRTCTEARKERERRQPLHPSSHSGLVYSRAYIPPIRESKHDVRR